MLDKTKENFICIRNDKERDIAFNFLKCKGEKRDWDFLRSTMEFPFTIHFSFNKELKKWEMKRINPLWLLKIKEEVEITTLFFEAIKDDRIDELLPYEERWLPKDGEQYYTVNREFKIHKYIFNDDSVDRDLINSRNYFKTKEEAAKVVNAINAELDKSL